jgi:HSP90 family molecular chaperone
MEAKDVTEAEHLDFYRYVANAYDKPYYWSPLALL